jgi:hypothetical protein
VLLPEIKRNFEQLMKIEIGVDRSSLVAPMKIMCDTERDTVGSLSPFWARLPVRWRVTQSTLH